MGGFLCDVVFNTWYSYSTVTGVTVDGEFIPFSEFKSDGVKFDLRDVRFMWTQRNKTIRYRTFSMMNQTLSTTPKGDTPGYHCCIAIELKDIVGDNGSCLKDVDVVKGRGPIEGAFLEVGSFTFTPPYELKDYLKKRDERIAEQTGYYTVGGFRNKVKDSSRSNQGNSNTSTGHNGNDTYHSSRGSNYSSNSGTGSYRGTNSTTTAREEHYRREAEKRRRVDEYNDGLLRQGNAIHQQSQQTWNNYQQTLRDVNNQFDQWHQNRMAAEEEDDHGEREESYRERMYREQEERAERERLEREAREEARRERERLEREAKEEEQRRMAAENLRRDNLAMTRQRVFSAFPAGELPSSASRVGTNKIYFFVFTVPGNLRDDRPETYLSNVFAIGQYPDGTWPLKTLIQSEVNALTNSTGTIHGYYTSEQEAENARNSFRDHMSNSGITVRAISYPGKNADVIPTGQQGVKPTVDFWGNPINAGASQTRSNPRSPQQVPDAKPKLDFWGNPVKD